jgi:mannosyltransferase
VTLASSTLERRPSTSERLSRHTFAWVTLAPGLVTFLVMLCGITGPSYWRDESATVSATDRSLPGLMRMLGRVDAVHGLYYVLMWLVARVAGTSELAFRLPSAFGMAVAAAGIAAIGWRLRGWRTGLLSGLVFACVPVISSWGQNARPYALAIAVAVLASYQLLTVIARPDRRRLAVYAAAIALLGYVNLFGLLLVPAHAITVATASRYGVRGRTLVGWVIAAAAGCLAVTPVAVFGWLERGQIAWIPLPGLSDVRDLVVIFGGGTMPTAMIITALALLSVVRTEWPARHRPDDALTRLCLPWLVLPPAILLVASQFNRIHVYALTYVLYCLPALALLAGAGLASLWTPVRIIALALIVVLVFPGQLAARGPDAHGDNIRAAASFLQRDATSGQAVLYWGSTTWAVPDWAAAYPYGFTRLRDIGEQTSPATANDLFGKTASLAVLEQRMRQVSQLWMVELGHDYPPPAVISAEGFHLKQEWQFSDIWLRLYVPS